MSKRNAPFENLSLGIKRTMIAGMRTTTTEARASHFELAKGSLFNYNLDNRLALWTLNRPAIFGCPLADELYRVIQCRLEDP